MEQEQIEQFELTQEPAGVYPAAQLRLLKEFYGLKVEDVVSRSRVATATVNNALQGRSSVDLRKFVKIADSLDADVVITLKPRDPRFIEFLKKMIPDSDSAERGEASVSA
jgi:transcriptional regulator with XRE-family HTH domain